MKKKHVEEMTMPEVMKAVLKKDKYFFLDMGHGEEKAIVLNGLVVTVCREQDGEDGLIGISMSRLRSIHIDTVLIEDEKEGFQL